MDTVKIQHSDAEGNDHMIINRADYDPATHKLASGELDPLEPHSDKEREIAADMEARRRVDANRGVNQGNAMTDMGKNPSGTYSEPTPTDTRYPNKNATEFENNHGAFIGKSAAQIRESAGMEDKPGGIHPEVHEKVQEAAQVIAAAAQTANESLPNATSDATLAAAKTSSDPSRMKLADANAKDKAEAIAAATKAKVDADIAAKAKVVAAHDTTGRFPR